jgi:hypothetical protein
MLTCQKCYTTTNCYIVFSKTTRRVRRLIWLVKCRTMTRWQRFLCHLMGWHACTPESFDGCSFGGHCRRCGVCCLQDSQGNWFAVGEASRG